MIIVFGAGWTGRTFLGRFLPWTHSVKFLPSTLVVWGVVWGVVLCSAPPPSNYLALGPSGPACLGRECRCLAPAACFDLPHQWRLIPATLVFAPLD